MKGRTAIVTGSTSGIGLAIAHALAAAGANVVLNGRGSEEENAEIIASVSRHGTRVAYEAANMLRHNQIAEMIERTQDQFGSLDILVNNAGVQHVAPVEDFPIENWDAVIAIDLTAPFVATRAAVPGMKRRGFGRIINVCSVHAMVASPFKSAYVAAKHGLAGLTKAVALELAGHNVTCNAISPGFVFTPLVEGQIPDLAKSQGITEDEARRQLLSRQPTGEFVKADDVGALAVFLAGDAAGAITGANFAIDGGWTAQ
jgi:3-hydroxybutyrate dehydrogenase